MTIHSKQFVLPFNTPEASRFTAFFSGEMNGEALNFLKSIAADDSSVSSEVQAVLIWGQIGSGLTHLLQASVNHCFENGLSAQYLPLSEVLRYSPEAVCDGLEYLDVIYVDDLHLLHGHSLWQHSLFALYNRMKDAGKVMVFASHESPQTQIIELKDLHSRILSGVCFHIHALSELGLKQALCQRAGERGITLNDDVVKYIFTRTRRSTTRLFELLDILDTSAIEAQRMITVPFVSKILSEYY